ncbi:hypothetical protein KP509_11G072000 [Ceratopteris richardii]|uniref:Peroxisomal ATPase PEX6 n=2 Tax=Ceratopteris richardii TaxID=49495 RepID=A0A8T2TTR0_CERRI|nr:hypothetical protein KP509_11G072000 [Ceratopteris richardii]
MGRRRQPLILQRTADVLSNCELEVKNNEVESSNHQGLLLQAGLLYTDDPSSMPPIGPGHTKHDDLNIVGLSLAALKRLSLRSGSWVMVRHVRTKVGRPAKVLLLDPPHTATDYHRWTGDTESKFERNILCFLPCVALQSFRPLNLRGDAVYLSPVLAYNLGLHITWLHQWLSCRCNKKPVSSDASESCLEFSLLEDSKVDMIPLWKLLSPLSNGCQERPYEITENLDQGPFKFAFHVRIGHVKVPVSGLSDLWSEDTQDYIDVDSALQDYFKVSRVLARGDLFAVRVQADGKQHNKLFNQKREGRTVYFKVIAMEPEKEPFLLVNCKHSTLVLGDSIPSRLPPPLIVHGSDLKSPTWMMPMIYQLARILAPPLSTAPSLPLKAAVLLTGPAGCGKRTTVRIAAEAIGMHVVEYNCYELLGPTDGKTAAALSQAIQVARRYSPAVLLLRRFGALGKSSNSVTTSDSGGAVSRVVSALQETINQNLKAAVDPSERIHLVNRTLGQNYFKLNFEEHKAGLVLVVAAAESTEGLPPLLRRCFTHEFKLQPPDEEQRAELLHHLLHLNLQCIGTQSQENILKKECQLEKTAKSIASQTSGAVTRDLQAIVADAATYMLSDVHKQECSNQETCSSMDEDHAQELNCQIQRVADCRIQSCCEIEREEDESTGKHSEFMELSAKSVEKAFEHFKSRMSSELGAPKVPNVKWEDVGGLEDVKKAILDTVQLPLVHRDLFTSGLRQRSGVLLYGPPGTGKTLLAKAVATECSLKFLSVKGPELINMYIGESEKNVRDIFQKARTARPCVIFFDELDALAPARGASGDSGGVMDRVVSQMLAEIDGLNEGQQDLFIIGASNRPDLIDPALLRPGRFDKLLYVGISTELSYRQRVLEALTRKFQLDKDVRIEDVARICPVTFTGADMYALCADAWMLAVKRQVSMQDTNQDADIVVKHEDFTEALQELTPSLSQAELSRYERLRMQFEGQKASPSAAINQDQSSMNDLD